MSSNEADAIVQFQGLTGAPENQARFFLESANWDLEAAAVAFFENQDQAMAVPPLASASAGGVGHDDEEEEEEDGEWEEAPAGPEGQASTARGGPPSRFATLGDFNRDNDDDDDEQGKQNFFAGGEKSGISIQGPNTPNPSVNEAVRGILGQAVQRNISPPPQPTRQTFVGTGYTLGSDTQPSQPISSHPAAGSGPRKTQRTLTLWRNGFTIENSPLYAWTDQESLDMLREIRGGRIPRNVAGVQPGEEVEMVVVKREMEEWTPAQSRGTGAGSSFVGQGNRLGSAIPGEPVVPPPPATGQAPAKPQSQSPAQPTQPIDPSLPTTTLQLRLADGTRLVSQFNLSSTLHDLYSFVGNARPTENREFVLQTIFPTRVLEKSTSKTIEQEGLKGGTVVMRWKA